MNKIVIVKLLNSYVVILLSGTLLIYKNFVKNGNFFTQNFNFLYITNRASDLKFGSIIQLHMFSKPIDVKGLGYLSVYMGTEGRVKLGYLTVHPCE